MIDEIKDNWKTLLVGAITVALVLWGITGCDSKAVEEAPVKDVHEMTDEEIKETVF